VTGSYGPPTGDKQVASCRSVIRPGLDVYAKVYRHGPLGRSQIESGRNTEVGAWERRAHISSLRQAREISASEHRPHLVRSGVRASQGMCCATHEPSKTEGTAQSSLA